MSRICINKTVTVHEDVDVDFDITTDDLVRLIQRADSKELNIIKEAFLKATGERIIGTKQTLWDSFTEDIIERARQFYTPFEIEQKLGI